MGRKVAKIGKIFKQFGFVFSMKYLFYKCMHKDEQYIQLIYNYLLKYLDPLIKKYNKIEKKTVISNSSYKYPIWVCWWQGYNNMPELCKMLFKRLKNMIPINAELKLITLDNYLEYAKIPSSIIKKFENKNISFTTFSDVLRNYLIRDNGGLWIDASVFVSNNISKDFLENEEWWSINLYDKNASICNLGQKISNRKWSGFVQKGEKNNLLNSFVCDAFTLYYEKHDIIIDYFIQNLFIKIAYDNISIIHNMIDNIPINNVNVYKLYDNIDKEFNQAKYNEWNSNTIFYKLTQKRQYQINTRDNKITYFGAIKKICEESED